METAPATTATAQDLAFEVVEVFKMLWAETRNPADTEKHLWSMAVQIVATAHSKASQ